VVVIGTLGAVGTVALVAGEEVVSEGVGVGVGADVEAPRPAKKDRDERIEV
jgi:hypothetical protein